MPGSTITEETADVNKADRVYAHARILHNQSVLDFLNSVPSINRDDNHLY